MTSEVPKTPGILKHLPLLEKVFLLALVIGIILAATDISFTVLPIALIGLAATFFLSAYRPPEISESQSENEPIGFSVLLALTILPKVLWISSAISLVGIALYFFGTGNQGYKQALMIGILTIGIGLILLTFFLVSGAAKLKYVAPVMLRAVPAFLAGLYFFMK